MIGNDIVDWAQASRDSNWQRRGYLTKLFTPDEQQLIYEASHPEQIVWTLWSLKESVYKANLRQTGKRQFAPAKIHCQLQPEQRGIIEGTAFYDYTYRVRASLTPNYVASTAVLASTSVTPCEQIIAFKRTDYSHQRTELRRFIIHICAAELFLPASAITVQKDSQGLPFLVVTLPNTVPVHLLISLSHHGFYGAFVINRSSFISS